MNQSLIPTTPTQVQDISTSLAKSGYFKDAGDATKAFVKVLAGAELGLPAFQSMSGIHIVQGKPTLSAGLMAALIKRSGRYNYRIVGEHTAEACKIEFFEDGKSIGFSEMTMAEAKKANLHEEWDRDKNAWKDKATWKNFPKNMLFNRALSNGAKWHCPDIFGGPVYAEGEIEDAPTTVVDTTAEVVHEAKPAQQPVAQPAPKKLTKEENATLMRDIQKWHTALGELETDFEENKKPGNWDALGLELKEIPNLPITEARDTYRKMIDAAKELGVYYSADLKKFYVVEPDPETEEAETVESDELNNQLDQTLAANA